MAKELSSGALPRFWFGWRTLAESYGQKPNCMKNKFGIPLVNLTLSFFITLRHKLKTRALVLWKQKMKLTVV